MATKTKTEIATIARKNPKLAKKLEAQRLQRNQRVQARRRQNRREARVARQQAAIARETAGQLVWREAERRQPEETVPAAHTANNVIRQRKDFIITPTKVDVLRDGERIDSIYDVTIGSRYARVQEEIAAATQAFICVVHDLRDTI